MLDADTATLIKLGSVHITEHRIEVEGFEARGASCREVAVLAAVWALGRLQRELLATLEVPGGGNIIV